MGTTSGVHIIWICAVLLASSGNAQPTPVAAIDIPRGKTLAANDIRWLASDKSTSDSATAAKSSDNAPLGWIARRVIKEGEKLEPPAVTRPNIVLTGDKVRAIYQTNGVTIAIDGVAINQGAAGDTVFVRLHNRKRVRGRIEPDATISIL